MPDPSALPHPTLQGGVGGVAGQPGRRCHTLKDHHEQNAARKLPGSFSRTVGGDPAALRTQQGNPRRKIPPRTGSATASLGGSAASLYYPAELKMIGTSYEDGELPFQKRVAQKLMVVARDPWLQKRLNETLLPPDYNSLCALATLRKRFPETFDQWVEDGKITPSLQRNEISKAPGSPVIPYRNKRSKADGARARRIGHAAGR